MRSIAVAVLILLLFPVSGAQAQQSSGMKFTIQGGEGVQPPKVQSEQTARPLTNESIVKLVKAGLGEDTIVSIVNTQPGDYSLAVDDIIALKKAGVSEKVITAMVNKQAVSATPPSQGPPTVQAKRPSPPHIPGDPPNPAHNAGDPYIPGPDEPAVAVPVLPVRPAKMTFFDDAAYHNCLGRHTLTGEPCPPLEENDKVYHLCLQQSPHHEYNALSLDQVEAFCAGDAADPAAYLSTHPSTHPAIGKVRKVYVEKHFLDGGFKKNLGKYTCLTVVDSPDQADAILKVDYVRREYDGTEDGDIACGELSCTDGITVSDEFGVRHIIDEKFVLVDPKTGNEIEGWSSDKEDFRRSLVGDISKQSFAVLNAAVGCGE